MSQLSGTLWLVDKIVLSVCTVVAVLGSAANFCLFFVTLRSKSLRSNCHILIGLCAILDGFHQAGLLNQLPVLLGHGEMDSFTCSALQLLPELGLFGGCACVFFIGFERLMAVVFFTYRQHGHRLLVIQLLLVASSMDFGLYLMIAYFEHKTQVCSIPAPFHGVAGPIFGQSLCMMNISTVFVYCTVALIISKRPGVSDTTKKAFRSNFFVMTADVCGWAIGISALVLTSALETSDEIRIIMCNGLGTFVHAGIASKSLIYYSTNAEYRQAISRVLGLGRSPKHTSITNAHSFKSSSTNF